MSSTPAGYRSKEDNIQFKDVPYGLNDSASICACESLLDTLVYPSSHDSQTRAQIGTHLIKQTLDAKYQEISSSRNLSTTDTNLSAKFMDMHAPARDHLFSV